MFVDLRDPQFDQALRDVFAFDVGWFPRRNEELTNLANAIDCTFRSAEIGNGAGIAGAGSFALSALFVVAREFPIIAEVLDQLVDTAIPVCGTNELGSPLVIDAPNKIIRGFRSTIGLSEMPKHAGIQHVNEVNQFGTAFRSYAYVTAVECGKCVFDEFTAEEFSADAWRYELDNRLLFGKTFAKDVLSLSRSADSEVIATVRRLTRRFIAAS